MSTGTLRRKTLDPLLHEAGLPHTATLFPLGFRLEIATNSRDVLDAAAESWGAFEPLFERPPLRISVVVQPGGEAAPAPVVRARGHQFAIVSDRANFATYDSRSMTGCCFISEKTAADHAWFRWYFLECMVYMLLAQRHVVPVHAACVARGGRGVLLCGASGAGKSTLAYACARAGWEYLGDDSTFLLPEEHGRRAIGKPHLARLRADAPRLFPELAGYATGARPSGKLSMEVPLDALPEVRTARDCTVACVVFLKRESGAGAQATRMDGREAVERLLRDMPSYGDEVNAIYERAVSRLDGVPAYEMRYEDLAQARQLLEEFIR